MLVQNLRNQNAQILSEDEMMKNALLSLNKTESIPGSIRKAEHFLPMLRKLILYFEDKMKSREL